MIGINFDRDRMAELLDRLSDGRPFGSRRSSDDYLMLAGACVFAALSQGPPAHADGRLARMAGEYREAVGTDFTNAVCVGVNFCTQMAREVWDGEFTLPPRFGAVVADRDGEHQVHIVPR